MQLTSVIPLENATESPLDKCHWTSTIISEVLISGLRSFAPEDERGRAAARRGRDATSATGCINNNNHTNNDNTTTTTTATTTTYNNDNNKHNDNGIDNDNDNDTYNNNNNTNHGGRRRARPSWTSRAFYAAALPVSARGRG